MIPPNLMVAATAANTLGASLEYIDSGLRDPSQAVGTWLSAQLGDDLAALRIQTGFFSEDALPLVAPALHRLARGNSPVEIIVGSNDGGTLASHLASLAQAVGIPRSAAQLGLVYYRGAYFHPKTYHVTREDGSQCAYVGSANFTHPGITAKHVEAGIILDTRAGDPAGLLQEIADATTRWFGDKRDGLVVLQTVSAVEDLLKEGLVAARRPPRPTGPVGTGGKPPARPSLVPLLTITLQGGSQAEAADTAEQAENGQVWTSLPSVQKTPPYPPYMLFAPDAAGPTRGQEAISGSGLGTSVGLVIKLSRDNDRHWREAPGTANFSIPVSTASTLRFGTYGERGRPRAEFDLKLRYLDAAGLIGLADGETNVMSFGFTPGDVGHGDLRMVLPRPPIAQLRATLLKQGKPLPQAGDLAMLEWPTPEDPTFRLTHVAPNSKLAKSITEIWRDAADAGQLVSRGACWLPAEISPNW